MKNLFFKAKERVAMASKIGLILLSVNLLLFCLFYILDTLGYSGPYVTLISVAYGVGLLYGGRVVERISSAAALSAMAYVIVNNGETWPSFIFLICFFCSLVFEIYRNLKAENRVLEGLRILMLLLMGSMVCSVTPNRFLDLIKIAAFAISLLTYCRTDLKFTKSHDLTDSMTPENA